MGKIDKIINKFFDNLKRGRLNSFTKDMLKDPELKKSIVDYKKKEKELADKVRQRYAEYL